MKKLSESILIMNKFSREIGHRINLIVDFEFPKQSQETISDRNMALLNSLFYMSVIDSISYLDEYQQYFGSKTETVFKERITIVKAINKPFISRINKWKNLRDLRNHLLAHNLRIGKNGRFIFSIKDLNYDAPRNINDLYLLHNLISFSSQTVNSEFKEELEKYGIRKTEKLKENDKILSKDQVSTITAELVKEANMIKKEKNRNYEFLINELIDWNKL
ncbi:MAG: hypothetical protein JEZ09_15735 [Salinivirgaceae bacterium]|nr:hypothetical protein [Salinivirgaceae bacterium]